MIEDYNSIMCYCHERDVPNIIKYFKSKGMCLFDWGYPCPLDDEVIHNDFTESLSFMDGESNDFGDSVIYCINTIQGKH